MVGETLTIIDFPYLIDLTIHYIGFKNKKIQLDHGLA